MMMGNESRHLAHMVFFTLKESTDATRQSLVDSCDEYLTGHPGTLYYSAGVRGEEFQRSVNDQQFDVALHVVFKSKAAHDAYQSSPRHDKFIEANEATWKSVYVCDSYVS